MVDRVPTSSKGSSLERDGSSKSIPKARPSNQELGANNDNRFTAITVAEEILIEIPRLEEVTVCNLV